MSNTYVPRINQLDSKDLDEDVSTIINGKLIGAFSYVGYNIFIKFQPEIHAFINGILYHFTLTRWKQTVGQSMLQIKYEDKISYNRLGWYAFSLILCKWFKERESIIFALVSNENVKNKLKKINYFLEISYQTLDILNIYIFFLYGKYPSLVERIFNLNVIPSKNMSRRQICYEYFTRELLWSGFAELLSLTLPLVPFDYFHNCIKTLLPKYNSSNIDCENDSLINETKCIICNNYLILPHTIGCKHYACYYCIYSSIAHLKFSCPVCDIEVRLPSIRPAPKLVSVCS